MLGIVTKAALGYVLSTSPAVLSSTSRAAVSMATQDELKKQVGYQAIDDYVRSRVPGGAPRGSAPRAPRRPTTGPAHP